MWEVNQKQLAAALKITSRQVRNLRDQGMFAFIPNTKKYDLPTCIEEYLEFKLKAETGRRTSIDKEKEQAEHEQLKKEITKLKLRKMRKEVHEAADVEQFLNNMLLNFRNRLLSVPAKIAPQILNESDINIIINQLTKEMLETLDELSEYDPDVINKDNAGIEFDDDDAHRADRPGLQRIPPQKAGRLLPLLCGRRCCKAPKRSEPGQKPAPRGRWRSQVFDLYRLDYIRLHVALYAAALIRWPV